MLFNQSLPLLGGISSRAKTNGLAMGKTNGRLRIRCPIRLPSQLRDSAGLLIKPNHFIISSG